MTPSQTLYLLLDLALILGLARVLGVAARALGQPAVGLKKRRPGR
ncbi:hypothetical protein [Streptomyces yerevanensis]|nr:hypothetical protein [Streptomyces yerevanensis]